MALKAEAEEVADKAHRIVAIILFVQKTTIAVDENPDLTLTISNAQKQAAQDKVAILQSQIKSIVQGW